MHPEPQLKACLASVVDRPAIANPVVLVILGWAVWILAWYWHTTFSMVEVWSRSGTFTHGFVVFPVFAYFVWRERILLGQLPVRPFPPALALVAAAGCVWLLGTLAGVAVVEQAAMIALIPLTIWAVLGTDIARALLFPLAFLVFAVPWGEFLVPKLMDVTADMTFLALKAVGIPTYREGNDLVIPSGRWSVVEACSGIRYLIAGLMGGVLFAHLFYRSLKKRLAFIAFSFAAPVVANWVRAFLIIMLGHLSDNRIAAGVDHLIYGWVFFGLVIALMFWIGSRWADNPAVGGSGSSLSPATRKPSASIGTMLVAGIATLMLVSLWKPGQVVFASSADSGQVVMLEIVAANGWSATAGRLFGWSPNYQDPLAEHSQIFSKGNYQVGLFVAYYRDQQRKGELINALNTLSTTTNTEWFRVGSGDVELALDQERIKARTVHLRGRTDDLVAYQWYWIDGRLTSSDHVGKFYLARSRVTRRGDDSAAIVIFTGRPELDDNSTSALATFVKDMWPEIKHALERARVAGEQ